MEFLEHDLLNLRPTCPPEDISISIKKSDPLYGNNTHSRMPLDRIQYDRNSGMWADFPRKQVSIVNVKRKEIFSVDFAYKTSIFPIGRKCT